MTVTIHTGDCIIAMRAMPACSVDAVVTDPPYGIRFMGKTWDGADIVARHAARQVAKSADPQASENGAHKSIASEAGKYDLSPVAMQAFQSFSEEWAREAMRVLKPGGYLLSFASARTYHRMVCGIEAAGFEIRDQIMWIYGSGFPKSHNGPWGGTALKPAHEPIVVGRKPLAGTVAANHAAHGTGALNIDACRVGDGGEMLRTGASTIPCRHDNKVPRGRAEEPSGVNRYTASGATNFAATPGPRGGDALGRWPANVIHDGSTEVVSAFPDAPGQQGDLPTQNHAVPAGVAFGQLGPKSDHTARTESTKSAARFFYCAKPSKSERELGLADYESGTTTDGRNVVADNPYLRDAAARKNTHPTVKPIALMRYLLRLVTPAGGTVLDPFLGSGTTACAAVFEGLDVIGVELDPAHVEIALGRVAGAERQAAEEAEAIAAKNAQTDMFNAEANNEGRAA